MNQFQPQTKDKNKLVQYEALVHQFKEFRFTGGDKEWINPYEVPEAKFEELCRKQCGILHLNPWNLWQGHLDADILVIGKDWGCLDNDRGGLNSLSKALINDIQLKTNSLAKISMTTDKKLYKIISEKDCKISEPYRLQTEIKTKFYFTNAILGIRKGKQATGKVETSSLSTTSLFLNKLVSIINPKQIICLDRTAFESIQSAFLEIFNDFIWHTNRDLVQASINGRLPKIGKTELFVVFHPVSRMSNTCDGKKAWANIPSICKQN